MLVRASGVPIGLAEACVGVLVAVVWFYRLAALEDLAAGMAVAATGTLLLPTPYVRKVFPDGGGLVAALCLSFAVGGTLLGHPHPMGAPVLVWVGAATWLLFASLAADTAAPPPDRPLTSQGLWVYALAFDVGTHVFASSEPMLPGWARITLVLGGMISILRGGGVVSGMLWTAGLSLWVGAPLLHPDLFWVRLAIWLIVGLLDRQRPTAAAC